MAITSNTSRTIFVRTWTAMIIFCFAGCAAGSCLSYGHSCWGAHGKRSGGHNNNAYIVPSRSSNDVQEVPSFTKEQWILSRLIGRPSVPNKYRERWDRPFKIKIQLPQHSDSGDLNAHMISDVPIRDKNNNEDGDDGQRRNINDIRDIVGNVNDERQEIPDILLMSSNENNERGSKPQHVQLFKFLDDSDDNFE
ncbi:neuropeptide CCHamide 1 [Andrena cerasifolii]|uniref:neuropeptide CCHamide 1 n=1 Tax=Andrena cerasifolii TaxID=2819439 RepID=UPI004037B5C2